MDFFARVANNDKLISDEFLKPVEPEPLKSITIELKPDNHAEFIPYKKMDSGEELVAELKKLRCRMQEFLADYTPTFSEDIYEIQLSEFRYSLNGKDKGNVKIPHYGGPTGRHRAGYETEFQLDRLLPDKRVLICFDGVDYIATVYINDNFVGRHEGFFAPFEFDITDYVNLGTNTLRVVVDNDFVMMGNRLSGECDDFVCANGDKMYAATGPGWDDCRLGWHHCPPGFGIYNKVYVQIRNKEYITDVFPRVNSKASEVWVECFGSDIEEKDVSFRVSVYGQNFNETVFENLEILPKFQHHPVGLRLSDLDVTLKLENGFNRFILPIDIPEKRLWNTEKPYLYQVRVAMIVDGKQVSIKKCQFGIRDFEQITDTVPKGEFRLNGTPVRLFGANTMGFEQQAVMKQDFERLIDDILLAKLCNMNFLRITQRPVQKEIYEYCDRLGLMIQTDMPAFACLRINQYCEFLRQTQEMEKLIRSHPCCILVSYINEPNKSLNSKPHRMLDKFQRLDLFDSADTVIRLNNPDRVIKHVDGDYDPPGKGMTDSHCYTFWYSGHMIPAGKLHKGYWCNSRGDWYTGCGEFGVEGLESPEIMENYYPKEWIRQPFNPKNIVGAQMWMFHSMFFETPKSMEEWVRESQRHQSFGIKIMTSAFRRNQRMKTFAVHLFIDAFPSGWMKAIMDFKRNPKPAFFTYRDCLSPVFCNLRSDRFTFFEGERINIESYLVKDNGNADKVKYMVEFDGKCIASAEKLCEDDAFQGYISFQLPQVSKRSKIKIYMGAFDGVDPVHYACEEYEVFPKLEAKFPETISYEEYANQRELYDNLIESGKRIVMDYLPVGEYEICGKKVVVRPGERDVKHISRDTGHRLVDGFLPNDFSYLYDEKEDMFSHIIDTGLFCDDAKAILTGCEVNQSKKDFKKSIAVGEITVGKGYVILNQLLYRTKMKNPVVCEFISRVTEYVQEV